MVAGCRQGRWMSKSDLDCERYDGYDGETTRRALLWTNSLPRKNKRNPGDFGFYERTESCYVSYSSEPRGYKIGDEVVKSYFMENFE